MPFRIIRDDIARVRADAIVCSASAQPTSGGGAEAAIHKAAGPGLLRARTRLGRLEPGAAAVTKAYRLHARYVIHTVGPVWRDGNSGEVDTLRQCYRNAISTALSMGCKSAAFPLIASGRFGFSKSKALRVALNEFQRFAGEDIELILVVYDREAYTLSSRRGDDVAAYIDENYVSSHPPRGRLQASYDSEAAGRFTPVPAVDQKVGKRTESETEDATAEPLSLEEDEARTARFFRDEDIACSLQSAQDADLFGAAYSLEDEPDKGLKPEQTVGGTEGAPESGVAHADTEQASVSTAERTLADKEAEYPFAFFPTHNVGGVVQDTQGYPRAAQPAAPERFAPQKIQTSAEVASRQDLESRMKALDAGFSETLLRLIDESGCTDAEIYKRANVSRKLFSKIRSAPNYRPSKPTALAFCVALHMKPNEARDLLARAGYAISHSSRLDVIVEYFLETGNYDIIEINETLFCYDQPLLGSA